MLQRLVYIVDSPSRILPFGPKGMKHEISPETAEKLTDYLEKNDLRDVYVCVNHYDPAGEWRRLKENQAISPVWRYSLGMFSFVGYTLLPNPLFRTNKYNPYTNSLYLNSDQPLSILHEAAVAKEIHSQKLPGSYTALTSLPGMSLVRETRVVGELVGYARAEQDWKLEQETYRVLYPQVGGQSIGMAANLSPVWWARPIVGMTGSAVGHVAGRTVESNRSREMREADVARVMGSRAEPQLEQPVTR
jgi:hypothetical protein